jgi:hypothetical protein
MVGSYYNVPSIQVTAANQILVSVTSIPASWIAGDQVKIVAFNQTVFNTTMTILSVTGSGFYSSFISGLPNGTYTSPTSYVYNYNNISIGTISGINVTAINTISANFLNAFLGAQIASLACTGTTSTQTLTSSTLFTASGGGINTNTLYATGLITAGAGISSFNNLISNGAMIVNGSSNPSNGVSAVWTRFESLALGGTITCGTFGTGYLPLSINSSVSDFTINGTSKMTLEATGNLNAKTSITTPNTSTGLLQAYNNGFNTSSAATIISSTTDWIGSSFGNFASITDASGNRQNGLGVGIDSAGNSWMLSLKPSVSWRGSNQLADSFKFWTNTFGSSNPCVDIDANGKTTIRSALNLRGAVNQALFASQSPNLAYFVNGDAYPVMASFNFNHNNNGQFWDLYYNGTNYISCFNSVNWMLYKNTGKISFYYSPAQTAGTASTIVELLKLTSTSVEVLSAPLLLKGPANQNSTSATSPNIKLFMDADSYSYPTLSSWNYNHDNVALQFDMYYDAGWYSSSNTVNWQIRKNVDRLFFQYIDPVPAGTAGSLQNMMVLTNTGVVISPTSGTYTAPNVLHLVKAVPTIGDTSLMITWENTTGGYYDFMAGYYREPLGGGTWQVRGGTASYTTALPLLTVYYNGYVGVNGVQSPAYALDTGNSSIGASSMNSSTSISMLAGTNQSFTVYSGADASLNLTQVAGGYNNIAQKNSLTSIGVGAVWYSGTLFTETPLPAQTSKAMCLGYSNTLDTGYIITLAPAVAWKNLAISSNQTNFYIQGTLAGYVNAGGFVSVSDEREKEDIKPLKTTRSLERVLQAKPVTYKRKHTDLLVTEEVKNKSHIGLLAQDTESSNPHCISPWKNEEKEERLGIQYSDYIIHLVGAVQELHKESLAWRAFSTELHKESLERNEKIKILEATILAQNNKLELFEAHLIQLTNQLNNITLNK